MNSGNTTHPLPSGKAVCLSELASLGKQGEGLAPEVASVRFGTPRRPNPHPSGLGVSVAGAPCDAKPKALSQMGEGAYAYWSRRALFGSGANNHGFSSDNIVVELR